MAMFHSQSLKPEEALHVPPVPWLILTVKLAVLRNTRKTSKHAFRCTCEVVSLQSISLMRNPILDSGSNIP